MATQAKICLSGDVIILGAHVSIPEPVVVGRRIQCSDWPGGSHIPIPGVQVYSVQRSWTDSEGGVVPQGRLRHCYQMKGG